MKSQIENIAEKLNYHIEYLESLKNEIIELQGQEIFHDLVESYRRCAQILKMILELEDQLAKLYCLVKNRS